MSTGARDAETTLAILRANKTLLGARPRGVVGTESVHVAILTITNTRIRAGAALKAGSTVWQEFAELAEAFDPIRRGPPNFDEHAMPEEVVAEVVGTGVAVVAGYFGVLTHVVHAEVGGAGVAVVTVPIGAATPWNAALAAVDVAGRTGACSVCSPDLPRRAAHAPAFAHRGLACSRGAVARAALASLGASLTGVLAEIGIRPATSPGEAKSCDDAATERLEHRSSG